MPSKYRKNKWHTKRSILIDLPSVNQKQTQNLYKKKKFWVYGSDNLSPNHIMLLPSHSYKTRDSSNLGNWEAAVRPAFQISSLPFHNIKKKADTKNRNALPNWHQLGRQPDQSHLLSIHQTAEQRTYSREISNYVKTTVSPQCLALQRRNFFG